MSEAIEMAKDFTKPNPEITMVHIPPILVTDVKK